MKWSGRPRKEGRKVGRKEGRKETVQGSVPISSTFSRISPINIAFSFPCALESKIRERPSISKPDFNAFLRQTQTFRLLFFFLLVLIHLLLPMVLYSKLPHLWIYTCVCLQEAISDCQSVVNANIRRSQWIHSTAALLSDYDPFGETQENCGEVSSNLK